MINLLAIAMPMEASEAVSSSASGFVLAPKIAIVAVLGLLVPILIARYVYKDAKSRNMDATLWVVVTLLIPSFIGLIIYLIVRSNNPVTNCPSCKNPVDSDFVICPFCGASLKEGCPNCGAAVSGGWKLCPKCGTELHTESEMSTNALSPPKRDRSLVVILLIVLLVPIIIAALLFGVALLFRANFSSGSVYQTEEGYNISLENLSDSVKPYIEPWIEECDAAGNGVYVAVLKDAVKSEEFQDWFGDRADKGYVIYVYVSWWKGVATQTSFIGSATFDKGALTIRYDLKIGGVVRTDTELSRIALNGYNLTDLTILLDGEPTQYKRTDIEW